MRHLLGTPDAPAWAFCRARMRVPRMAERRRGESGFCFVIVPAIGAQDRFSQAPNLTTNFVHDGQQFGCQGDAAVSEPHELIQVLAYPIDGDDPAVGQRRACDPFDPHDDLPKIGRDRPSMGPDKGFERLVLVFREPGAHKNLAKGERAVKAPITCIYPIYQISGITCKSHVDFNIQGTLADAKPERRCPDSGSAKQLLCRDLG
jgi:hypothetical protein